MARGWRAAVVAVVAVVAAMLAGRMEPGAVAAEDVNAGDVLGNVNVLDMMSKIPALMPFLESKIGSAACKPRIAKFSKDIEEGVARVKSKGDNKAYVPVVRKAWCGLGRACTKDIVDSFAAMLTPGGFLEKMVKAQLEVEDLSLLPEAIMMYFEEFCEKAEREES